LGVSGHVAVFDPTPLSLRSAKVGSRLNAFLAKNKPNTDVSTQQFPTKLAR
jgi:hypothetical protein